MLLPFDQYQLSKHPYQDNITVIYYIKAFYFVSDLVKLCNSINICKDNIQYYSNALPLDGISGHNCDHSDEEQSHQQLFVGAVIALAGLLTAAIITVFLLLIKLR